MYTAHLLISSRLNIVDAGTGNISFLFLNLSKNNILKPEGFNTDEYCLYQNPEYHIISQRLPRFPIR